MASSLGIDRLNLRGVKHAFNFSTKGLSQKQIEKKIEAELTKYGSKLAGKVSGLNAYVEDGETKLAALTRLSSALTTVNTMFEGLGHTLFDTSLAGADAASGLVEAFGGLEEFSSATSTYFDKFYSDQEKFQFSSAQLAKQLEELGINVVPTSAEAFRALVDHAAEAGDHELYAGLVGLAGDMDSVLTQADGLRESMGGVEKSFTSLAEERLAKALQAQTEAFVGADPEAANDEESAPDAEVGGTILDKSAREDGGGYTFGAAMDRWGLHRVERGPGLSNVVNNAVDASLKDRNLAAWQSREVLDELRTLVSLTKETRDDQAREAA